MNGEHQAAFNKETIMRYAGFSLMLIALASVGWLAMDQQVVADQEINANHSALPKLEVGSPFSEEYWAYLRAMRQDELKPDLAASLLLASGTIVQISKGIEDEELLAAKHVASELER